MNAGYTAIDASAAEAVKMSIRRPLPLVLLMLLQLLMSIRQYPRLDHQTTTHFAWLHLLWLLQSQIAAVAAVAVLLLAAAAAQASADLVAAEMQFSFANHRFVAEIAALKAAAAPAFASVAAQEAFAAALIASDFVDPTTVAAVVPAAPAAPAAAAATAAQASAADHPPVAAWCAGARKARKR